MRRLLMYSQDGMGLGHLRRSSNIAQEILARNPDCDILILADSPAISLFVSQPGVEFLKLPTIVKTGSSSWVNATLSAETQRMVQLRARVILETFREFGPDTVLVDQMPVGALGELKPMLEYAGRAPRAIKLFLGLRDVLDDPAVIVPVWTELGAYEHLLHYDAVLVYGNREVYDTSSAYGLRTNARAIVDCNYVSPPSPTTNSTESSLHPFILMMGGGGADAFPLAKAFADALPILNGELQMEAVLLTGPNMPVADRKQLFATNHSSLYIVSGFEDAARWIQRAAAVVTMGGYNSLCEVLKWQRKALVVPRRGPSAEQRIRSRVFAERSLIRMLDPERCTAETLARELIRLLAEDGVPDATKMPPLDGAERAATALLEWEAPRDRSRRKRAFRRADSATSDDAVLVATNGRRQVDVARALPLLAAILDLEAIGRKLRGLLLEGHSKSRARVRSVEVISYKPRNRALAAYELEQSPGGERIQVLGKHVADTRQAARIHEVGVALHRVARSFVVPQPLAWLPELSLVLFQPLEGRTLGEALLGGEADALSCSAAESLAELHSSGISLDRRFDLDSELANLVTWAMTVGDAHDELGPAALQLAHDLGTLGRTIGFDHEVPIHKDFHHEHVLVDSKLAILDVDEMRIGDPTFDLAHFCTYLRLLGMRSSSSARVEGLQRAFLRAYARRSGWRKDERFAYFSAYSCLKIAKQLCTGRGIRPIPRGADRKRELRAVLAHGAALARTLC